MVKIRSLIIRISIISRDEVRMELLHKIKIFKSIQQDMTIMEEEINQWLSDNPGIQIIQLTQSEIGSKRVRDIVISIFYAQDLDS